ncbi:hypothetical protein TH44_12480 [Thalassospira xiamenensis]|uniref:Ammonia monooxygenase n=2 Tax=Thalassospira xiamenensis TaxID=220697 RepID=A0A367X8S3_9PROT|nr:hypothetical protein AUP41_16525 [Thalassospira xiamenensis]RCK50066.1 hypothetical protein TH44_12480 [Thalassospira xiamenensis]
MIQAAPRWQKSQGKICLGNFNRFVDYEISMTLMQGKLFLSYTITIVISLIGMLIAGAINMPLPWMLGPLFITAACKLSGIGYFDANGNLPKSTSKFFIPIIGIAISANVTPAIIASFASWWPSMVLVVPFNIVLQFIIYRIFLTVGKHDRATAYFSSCTGGVTESILLGSEKGGNASVIAFQHSARVFLAISIVPFMVLLLTSLSVHPRQVELPELNSVGGVYFPDVFLMISAAVGGALTAFKLRLPAAAMIGPLTLGVILYSTEIITMPVPEPVLHIAQLFVGTILGARFKSKDRAAIIRGAPMAVMALCVSIPCAGLIAYLLAHSGVANTEILFLSFAPGGLAEMSLVAISLDADPVFVAAHHLIRIMSTIFLSPLIFIKLIEKQDEVF